MRLVNKVAVITGGNSGIGFSTAQEYLQQGASKVIITGRNEAALKEAVLQLGDKADYIVSDAGNLQHNLALGEALRAKGIEKIDILFFNAGVGQFAPVAQMPTEMFENIMQTNFRGAFFTVQSLLPLMGAGGSIIFNASVLATITMSGNSAYGASKAALVMLAKTLAVELAGQNIRANSISPGCISTPIYGKLGMEQAQLDAFAAGMLPKIPANRFGNPSEIAKATVFLGSDDSSYVTGSEIVVDGGATFSF